jgi:acyl dehydratase
MGDARVDKDLYFEDMVPGTVYEFGSIKVEEKEILEFSRRYDPQDFHSDPEAAKRTSFGGLVASGWHTAAMAMRMIVDNRLSRINTMGSPGVDELRWLKPVRPGDLLSVRLTIIEARRSQSKPDRGTVRWSVQVLNQSRDVVTSWKGMNIVISR